MKLGTIQLEMRSKSIPFIFSEIFMKEPPDSEHVGHVGLDLETQTTSVSDENAWTKEHFRTIYTEHYDSIWRYCIRRCSDIGHVEEVVADTFTVAWSKLDAIPKGSETKPWLYGVARNHLRNSWRKSKRSIDLTNRLKNELATDATPIDPETSATEDASQIIDALQKLKFRDQEILRLSCWEKLTHSQIATVLGCSDNAATIRVHRAKEKLSKQITKLSQINSREICVNTPREERDNKGDLKSFEDPQNKVKELTPNKHLEVDGTINLEGGSNE